MLRYVAYSLQIVKEKVTLNSFLYTCVTLNHFMLKILSVLSRRSSKEYVRGQKRNRKNERRKQKRKKKEIDLTFSHRSTYPHATSGFMEGPLFPHRVGKKHGHVSPRTSAADPRQTRLPSFIPSQMTVGLEDDYHALKKDHDTIEIELKTLRETYNSRQDTWIKEKLDMQVRIKRKF